MRHVGYGVGYGIVWDDDITVCNHPKCAIPEHPDASYLCTVCHHTVHFCRACGGVTGKNHNQWACPVKRAEVLEILSYAAQS